MRDIDVGLCEGDSTNCPLASIHQIQTDQFDQILRTMNEKPSTKKNPSAALLFLKI